MNLIEVHNNDFFIDEGACCGDTALYFANKAGENVKVFSFEFLEENIVVYNKNLDLNPRLKQQIKLIERPLDINSSEVLCVRECGPGTSLTKENVDGSQEWHTIYIDDFVEQNNIDKIDFIKLDI